MIENRMVIGDDYYDSTYEPDTCSICKEEEYEMLDTWRGLLCSSCTRKCTICGDWMLDEVGVKDSKCDAAHKDCADELRDGKELCTRCNGYGLTKDYEPCSYCTGGVR